MPSSTACFSAWSAPPASRTLVKPRRSMPRRIGSERSTTRGLGQLRDEPEVDVRERDVHVAVDQPGHHGAPAGVDHVGIARGDGAARHLANDPVLDEQLVMAEQLALHRVEQVGAADEDGGHGAVQD